MERVVRRNWIDALRVLMCLFVVILHVASSGVVRKGAWLNGIEWQYSNIWDGLVRCAVPVFVMISGALLLSGNCDTSPKRMKERACRIIEAYFFWSLVYSVWYMSVLYKGNPFSVDGFIAFLGKVILGGYGHLWFLPMMLGVYLVLPFMKKVAEDEILTRRYLLLWGFFWSVVPVIRLFPVIGDVVYSFFSSIQVFLPLGYSGLFLLGHVLYEKVLARKVEIIICIMGITGIIVTIVGTSLLTNGSDRAVLPLYDYWMPNVIMPAVMFFTLFKKLDGRIEVRGCLDVIIRGLSSLTFGIYLVHILIIKLLWKLGFNIYSFTSILSIPIVSISVFILSAFISWLLKKVRIPM